MGKEKAPKVVKYKGRLYKYSRDKNLFAEAHWLDKADGTNVWTRVNKEVLARFKQKCREERKSMGRVISELMEKYVYDTSKTN